MLKPNQNQNQQKQKNKDNIHSDTHTLGEQEKEENYIKAKKKRTPYKKYQVRSITASTLYLNKNSNNQHATLIFSTKIDNWKENMPSQWHRQQQQKQAKEKPVSEIHTAKIIVLQQNTSKRREAQMNLGITPMSTPQHNNFI